MRVEDLPAYNRNAADIVAGFDWDRPDALEAGKVPHGLRVVDARHAVVVHAGWRGVSGLIGERREGPYPKIIDDAMKDLAMAMAKLRVPFLSHGMKRDVERYAARFAPLVARRYEAEYNLEGDKEFEAGMVEEEMFAWVMLGELAEAEKRERVWAALEAGEGTEGTSVRGGVDIIALKG